MENQGLSNQQFNAQGKQILNVSDPARPTDGANKRYVDNNAGGKFLNQVNKTTSFNTNSTSFVDITGLTITETITSGKRVMLFFSGPVANDTLGAYNSLTFTVDGTAVGASDGLFFARQEVAAYWEPCSIMFITDALTAGSHTFKVQTKVDTGTVTINSGATNLIFNAIQF
jgi:hypothetical protein